MNYGIKEVSSFKLMNKKTGEIMFEGNSIGQIESSTIKNTYSDNLKAFPVIRNFTLKISDFTLDNKWFNEMLQQPSTFKVIASPVFEKDIKFLKLLGFEIQPFKRHKSKRVQKKWNKKYGYRAINKNVKSENIHIQ